MKSRMDLYIMMKNAVLTTAMASCMSRFLTNSAILSVMVVKSLPMESPTGPMNSLTAIKACLTCDQPSRILSLAADSTPAPLAAPSEPFVKASRPRFWMTMRSFPKFSDNLDSIF